MAQQWEVESATGRCAATGRILGEGEEFHTVLFEEGESFRRSDFSLDAWNGPPDNAFCSFKTRVPFKEKKKQLLVNKAMLLAFFERLSEETEPLRVQFRFVLALILMRQRTLRYDGSVSRDGTEIWTMTVVHDQSLHEVVNPHLTDEQIETVSRELGSILHSDMGEWADADSATQQVRSAAPPTDRDEVEPGGTSTEADHL